MKQFTFFWKDGKREVLAGNKPHEALNNAGYGGGAVAALDFYAEGDNYEYCWNPNTRYWDKITTTAQED